VLLDAQISRCLDLGVGAFSFFWDVVPEVTKRVKEAGCVVLHQVGTAAAAHAAEAAGADILIAQGIEAGGHVHERTGAFTLANEILRDAHVPVVVSGGIADGGGLAAALAMGAAGIQCGTAFLATPKFFAHVFHKECVVDADGADTVLTDAFVLNWPAGSVVRVIRNSITDALGDRLLGHDPESVPRETIAWDGDAERFRFSTDSPLKTTTGNLEAMALYAGQGVGLIHDVIPAGERVRRMVETTADHLARVSCVPPGEIL
jgi:nitronate monooxygenase